MYSKDIANISRTLYMYVSVLVHVKGLTLHARTCKFTNVLTVETSANIGPCIRGIVFPDVGVLLCDDDDDDADDVTT